MHAVVICSVSILLCAYVSLICTKFESNVAYILSCMKVVIVYNLVVNVQTQRDYQTSVNV